MATIPAISLEPVASSRLAAIGHDPDTFTLAVRFPPAKNSPAGKVYHYANVSEELFDDLKNAQSVGVFFGEHIIKNSEKYPFACVDEGLGEVAAEVPAQAITAKPEVYLPSVAVPEEIASVEIPDDEEGLKARALTTRSEVTALVITTADECEVASREVLRIREERKRAIEKVNKIKIPATQSWQAACALFNEVDSRYAEAEKYLDGGILAYRAQERQRAAAEAARQRKIEDDRLAEARRQQEAETKRLQAEAEAEAKQRAAELAEQDAKAAEAQGAPAEVVEQILANPLPVAARHVAPPPLAYVAAPPPVIQQNIPKVAGLGFAMVWKYEITDESQIPLSHDYYTLDLKKINGRVQDLKKHANIPGVRVWDEETPIKNTGRAKK